MRRNHLATLVLALGLAGGSIAVAGCGGGGSSKSADAQSATVSVKETRASREHDCTALGHAADDLEMADAMGSGFQYTRDQTFMDGYADRAPSEVSDSVKRLRDVLDKFASVAQKVGLEPGKDPLPDQVDEFKNDFHFSSDDQQANARAVQTVDTWVSNGCE
jgi:hypothetical protein